MATDCDRCAELEAECDALTADKERLMGERDDALDMVEAMRETPYLRAVE